GDGPDRPLQLPGVPGEPSASPVARGVAHSVRPGDRSAPGGPAGPFGGADSSHELREAVGGRQDARRGPLSARQAGRKRPLELLRAAALLPAPVDAARAVYRLVSVSLPVR